MARAAVVYAQNTARTGGRRAPDDYPAGRGTSSPTRSLRARSQPCGDAHERAYSKDRILELYLNESSCLGAYGIAAASLVYFDKSVNELTIAEAPSGRVEGARALHPVRTAIVPRGVIT